MKQKIILRNVFAIGCLVAAFICIVIGICVGPITKAKEEPTEMVLKVKAPDFYYKTPKEGLKEALKFYEIKDDSIVYAIAILETGNFTSKLCINNNNLFGLYDSQNHCYFKFNNWVESVEAYKNLVEYKRKSTEDMYEFLKRITYAEDSLYIRKLKNIVKSFK